MNPEEHMSVHEQRQNNNYIERDVVCTSSQIRYYFKVLKKLSKKKTWSCINFIIN